MALLEVVKKKEHVTKEQFDKLSLIKVASWAVWSPGFDNPGCVEDCNDGSFKNYIWNEHRNELKSNVILAGLNPSGKEKNDKNEPHQRLFGSFHTVPHRADKLLKKIISDGNLLNISGAYITDLSQERQSNSKLVKLNSLEVKKLFEMQLEILGSKNYNIICFGDDVLKQFLRIYKPPQKRPVKQKILRNGFEINTLKYSHNTEKYSLTFYWSMQCSFVVNGRGNKRKKEFTENMKYIDELIGEKKMKKTIITGMLFCLMIFFVHGAYGQPFPEVDGVFAYRVGQFNVFMINEAENRGNPAILSGADEAIINRYIPDGFILPVNAFLIVAPNRNILIDAGTGAGGIIVGKIRQLGFDPADIDTVLLTHLHGDHFGGLQASGIANFPNARVYVSERDIEHFTVTNRERNQGAVNALALYGERVMTFSPGSLGSVLTQLLPGISAIANYGHTPGHTVFLVESGNERLIIAGDFLHVGLVQFPLPYISATFDVDPVAAAASRMQVMDYAASNNIPIGGMHLMYPGIGTVVADGDGFRFTPVR
ncbi:MAG: MBL fold metallo-hydrolase [Treponema sp.]|nr:MBL fold metallo-hydrolase [Treponema sp.]